MIQGFRNLGIPILFLLMMQGCGTTASYFFGEARINTQPLPESNVELPQGRTLEWMESSALADSIVQQWAQQPVRNWQEQGKVNMPRIILAGLYTKTQVKELNEYIQGLEPWGEMGSTWALHKAGDYDFSLPVLTSILYLFDSDEEILFPETKDHMLKVLLVAEGGDPHLRVPRTFGLIKDTENHLLMGESSRYLKNRYLWQHGNRHPELDNLHNGMEDFILQLLDEIRMLGLYEFNSNPYLGYTYSALLNLEAFGSKAVRIKAREVLDLLNYSYALGSYNFKYYPPFRRRLERESIKSLSNDNLSSMMKVWLSFLPAQSELHVSYNMHHALMAACLPYRPADEVLRVMQRKEDHYFVKIGHGFGASPEIYSSGPGYLISAGGTSRGKLLSIVARPICLFLDDEANELNDVIHIKGKDSNFLKWNNTGVHANFACGNGPVHIPEQFQLEASSELWDIYEYKDLQIAIHSRDGLSIMTLFETKDPAELAQQIQSSNPDASVLETRFSFPEGSSILYDVEASRKKWVIKQYAGETVTRKFDKWPLIEMSTKDRNQKFQP